MFDVMCVYRGFCGVLSRYSVRVNKINQWKKHNPEITKQERVEGAGLGYMYVQERDHIMDSIHRA